MSRWNKWFCFYLWRHRSFFFSKIDFIPFHAGDSQKKNYSGKGVSSFYISSGDCWIDCSFVGDVSVQLQTDSKKYIFSKSQTRLSSYIELNDVVTDITVRGEEPDVCFYQDSDKSGNEHCLLDGVKNAFKSYDSMNGFSSFEIFKKSGNQHKWLKVTDHNGSYIIFPMSDGFTINSLSDFGFNDTVADVEIITETPNACFYEGTHYEGGGFCLDEQSNIPMSYFNDKISSIKIYNNETSFVIGEHYNGGHMAWIATSRENLNAPDYAKFYWNDTISFIEQKNFTPDFCFYTSPGYKGNEYCFKGNVSFRRDWYENDDMESVKLLHPGFLSVFRDVDYHNFAYQYSENVINFGGLNNLISSFIWYPAVKEQPEFSMKKISEIRDKLNSGFPDVTGHVVTITKADKAAFSVPNTLNSTIDCELLKDESKAYHACNEALDRDRQGLSSFDATCQTDSTHNFMKTKIINSGNTLDSGKKYSFPMKTLEEWDAEFPSKVKINANWFDIQGPPGFPYVMPCTDVFGRVVSDGVELTNNLPNPNRNVYEQLDSFAVLKDNDGNQSLKILPHATFKNILSDSSSEKIQQAVGGFIIVSKGKSVKAESIAKSTKPTATGSRSAIGLSEDGKTLYIVQVGSQGKGLNIDQLKHLMKRIGSYTAINLDNSGSSQLIYKDESNGQIIRSEKVDKNPAHQLAYRPIPIFLNIDMPTQ
ncbi:phosphodiester glycosidase family protein [Pseudoalteromonas viridis]|uniref:Phosphodiester glycosidase family protein n=1 Tax=Pseudoalteromonas viridis TaxID=339617 RepID=A0ABX7V3K4_9GAMM|nr:phosphodiester glycosidase family protein [Pseudoalteromonas viridis]QTL35466.1 phosphodiester glycosidase family protein [Pseudoalteromonas viridis]